MIIDNNLTPYIFLEGGSILEALNKINVNQSRVIFTISDTGIVKGVIGDGEGVQFGEGEIDFPAMISWLNQFSLHSSFISEIWPGHKDKDKDNGSGFWKALHHLEQWKF